MSKAIVVRAGEVYGRLVLTGNSYIKNEKTYVEYICVCNKNGWARISSLKNNHTQSCGCLQIERTTKHGLHSHPIYRHWEGMKNRCYNVNYSQYRDYGGRGIIICEEWINSPEVFIKWAIYNGWKKGLQLDRINNNGVYEPLNCRWTTTGEQRRNTRITVNLTAFGETKCISDWVTDERCSINANSIQKRIKKGWNIESAIITPSNTTNKNHIYK